MNQENQSPNRQNRSQAMRKLPNPPPKESIKPPPPPAPPRKRAPLMDVTIHHAAPAPIDLSTAKLGDKIIIEAEFAAQGDERLIVLAHGHDGSYCKFPVPRAAVTGIKPLDPK
jgi:hypothetical protein